MKQFKRLMSVMIAFVLALTLLIPVSAASTHTITINNEKDNHTYEAYQVFAGDLTGGKLVNIKWGNGVNASELLEDLNKLDAYKTCESAEDVAKVLATLQAEDVDAFASVVGKHLSETHTDSTQTVSPYTIEGLTSGYYLVKDQDDSVADNDAYTKYILKVVGDVKVDAKDDVPELEKKIVEGENLVDYNNVSVGDDVTYQLTSKVPAMDGYNKYYFIINDTLSNGLSLNEESFVVTVGDRELVENTDYTVEVNGQSFKVVFNNFLQYKDQTGDVVKVVYTAKLNKEAVIGVVGNPNTANLTYSNNPNYDYQGENKPTENEKDLVGETPLDTVITYVTGVELTKVDGSDHNVLLPGAVFEISGEKVNIVKVTIEEFVEDENGNYYKLVDGTYTKTAPADETESLYEEGAKTYTRTTKEEWVETSESVTAQAVTGEDGKLVFIGLSAGEYEITEIKAPDGYNLLTSPIKVTIGWSAPTADSTSTNCTWSTSVGNVLENGTIDLTVENNTGATLPGTGGMGTTVLYVAGVALILAAGILLVSKKKMNEE